MTSSEIKQIAQAREKETATTELKSFRKLIPFDDKQRKDIEPFLIYGVLSDTNE